MSRVFAAPVTRLWHAWTNDAVMTRWWGPHGYTATVRMDVREGGAFELTMHGDDGVAYPIEGIYLAVNAPHSLVMEMRLDNHPANWHDYLAELYTKAGGLPEDRLSLRVVMRVTFTAQDDQHTRLDLVQTYENEAMRDAFVQMGNAGGWAQSFEKLDKLLAG
ncbi:SRPBCC domain-containing protein [Asticcacaulis sp. EMRT-3]|uniref:SRPBCC family protein n=1 Tax=Asticcacaulis sp. EMRT-3 TaxID=3040349 RepID=UPI0024AF0A68|nr:SRPBCC domain-containing protein [Asticcacaulis sp. EMRT-3]MDI7775558.1 SRPBCC domain-containing protein [Asticcacaulis sp. EMRT-3]